MQLILFKKCNVSNSLLHCQLKFMHHHLSLEIKPNNIIKLLFALYSISLWRDVILLIQLTNFAKICTLSINIILSFSNDYFYISKAHLDMILISHMDLFTFMPILILIGQETQMTAAQLQVFVFFSTILSYLGKFGNKKNCGSIFDRS